MASLATVMEQVASVRSIDPVSSPTLPARPRRVRLEALDALRGLAALYVVLFHVRTIVGPLLDLLPKPWRLIGFLTDHGHDAVVTFIALSGFVLMLPVARANDGQLPGGFSSYIRRRARRILPPYFAALTLFLLLGGLWRLIFAGTTDLRAANPFLSNHATFAAVLSHLFMIFNLHPRWVLAIDSPMWSVATEWQIYFLFPLILLPLWRRIGLAASVPAAILIGVAPVLFLPRTTDFDTSCPWMLGVFSLGMAAAVVVSRVHDQHSPTPWALATLVCVAAIAFMQVGMKHAWHQLLPWHKDLLTGLAVSTFMIYLYRCQAELGDPSRRGRRRWVYSLLDSRAAVALGAFSYSLYLVHLPLLACLDVILTRAGVGIRMHILGMYFVGTAVCLPAGYAFYLLFERPFARGSKPAEKADSKIHFAIPSAR